MAKPWHQQHGCVCGWTMACCPAEQLHPLAVCLGRHKALQHLTSTPCLVAWALCCQGWHGRPCCGHWWLPLVVMVVVVRHGHGHGGGHCWQVSGVGVVRVHGALVAHVRGHRIKARRAVRRLVWRLVWPVAIVHRCRCWLEVPCGLCWQQPGRRYGARGVLLVPLDALLCVIPLRVIRLWIWLDSLSCWGGVCELAARHCLAAGLARGAARAVLQA